MKTEDTLQRGMFALARPLIVALLVVIGIVSVWTPIAHVNVAARWLRLPNFLFFAPVLVLVLAAGYQELA